MERQAGWQNNLIIGKHFNLFHHLLLQIKMIPLSNSAHRDKGIHNLDNVNGKIHGVR